ncbi:20S proteasome subunit alpha 4 [Pancytospora epiphaga]|nr:20S proteasome subunit alpha 4 [Pancytospora epiphaga]
MDLDDDMKNGIFNSEGRIQQVEYAQNASAQGSTIVIQRTNKTVQIAYENKQVNTLLIPLPKIYCVDKEMNIYILFSGLKPDSIPVLNEAIHVCRNYKYSTGEDISIEMLARAVGVFKQKYTVDMGNRPFGLRTVLITAKDNNPRIFIIETDGNFSEYRSCALGHKCDIVTTNLEENNGEGCIFKALLTVLQKDIKKIRAFELSEVELSEIPENVIRSKFDE